MNKARRKKLEEAFNLIFEAVEEEQEAFDNLPESFQYSDKGQVMEENIGRLEEAKDAIEEIINQ